MISTNELSIHNPFRLKVDSYPGRLFSRPLEEKIEIQNILSNGRETYLEFGSGSGKHLIERAGNTTQSNFIGFEIRYKRSFRTIEKAKIREIDNVYVVRGLSDLISVLVPDNSISGIWVNFPDPWEKPTRQKHRILNSRSLEIIHKKLKPGAFLAFKTDHPELFESTLEAVRLIGIYSVLEVTRDLHSETRLLADNVMTEFEGLFCSQGLPVHFFLVNKQT